MIQMNMQRWLFTLAIAWIGFTSNAIALSLGNLDGTALFGRSLDVSVRAILDSKEALPDANCLAAEVSYGESRVSDAAVTVTAERATSGDVRIRIRASAALDEPVVSILLRSTCNGAFSRRYVLLSEVERNVALPRVGGAPLGIARGGSPAATATNAMPGSASQGGGDRFTSDQAPPVKGLNAPEGVARTVQPQERRQLRESHGPVGGKPKADGAPASKPQLKLDFFDVAGLPMTLRRSLELSGQPSEDAAVRSQAQALWRALNASDDDAQRDLQHLQKLQAQLRTALDQSKRQTDDITALSTQLKEAEQARYLNPITIILACIAALAIAWGIWLWRRNNDAHAPWWRGDSDSDEDRVKRPARYSADAAREAKDRRVLPSQPRSDTSSSARPPVAGSAALSQENRALGRTEPMGLDFRHDEAATANADDKGNGGSPLGGRSGDSGSVDTTPPQTIVFSPFVDSTSSSRTKAARFGHSEFSNSIFSTSRLMATEELFDVQEQAAFFMSLNQPDQAIEVLKNHIKDIAEPSVLVYLDLLDIYHRTNREADYQSLRQEFNILFDAQVSAFGNYFDESSGLEAYPDVLLAIQEVWSQPQKALQAIEEVIYPPRDSPAKALNLLAYRELMLLYAMARELNNAKSTGLMLPTYGVISGAITAPADAADSGLTLDVDLLATPSIDGREDALILPSLEGGSDGDTESVPFNNLLDFDLSDFDSSAAKKQTSSSEPPQV